MSEARGDEPIALLDNAPKEWTHLDSSAVRKLYRNPPIFII
ncbi:hypothetical protein [Brevibacillus laterosporus]|nr:hypothetical protein [Brevibacillus laterosporus]MDN9012866.1 hypothetical protein [Brevibacillus laterosporus]MDO0943975.1 hypothetical protein [Brevibacillus laterosporus]